MSSFELLIKEAQVLISASKSLDYSKIFAHDPNEIAKLKALMGHLNIKPLTRYGESLDNYASVQQQNTASPTDKDAEAEKRRQTIVDILKAEGFEDRIDNVYNSFSGERNTPINRVPHHRGIPEFDVVIAADFAPVSGMHGVFINDREVMSIILPADAGPSIDWQVMKRKRYENPEQMIDIVTMIASGFDLS